MRFAKTIAAASLLFAGTAFAADAGLNIIPAPREINITGGECRLKGSPKVEKVAKSPSRRTASSYAAPTTLVRSMPA